MRNQQTIAQTVEARGRGVHTGHHVTMRLLQAPAGHGIRFQRTDLPGAPVIPATTDTFAPDELLRRTTLSHENARVCTVEHLLAAVYALGVDNLLIELDGPEPPFLDGSAVMIANLIELAGMLSQQSPCKSAAISHPISFTLGDAGIAAVPSEELRITFFFASQHPLLRRQSASWIITPETFTSQIAPARTFCFVDEIDALLRDGLIRGGSLASAVVIGRKTILNNALRFPDEPARHKILDFLGDLALLGSPVKGHFLVCRGGHRVNAAFGQFLRKELGL
ncbi:MAG: UDP-3-O-acyl-N-acetylglucosamine deacetylase [Candidatus Sumerlaeota bacterium]|nr:UDP-3-O-acyl-N-acetylglucosamine deacetylase [Candidatus Sumerlaeota bacterium]